MHMSVGAYLRREYSARFTRNESVSFNLILQSPVLNNGYQFGIVKQCLQLRDVEMSDQVTVRVYKRGQTNLCKDCIVKIQPL